MDVGEAGQGGLLRLSFEGRELAVRAGQAVRIGRNPDNELVTDVPTVSRQHGVLRWGPGGWEFENTGSAPTFVNGQQVTRVTVDRPLALVLGSADGPVLRAEPVAPAAPAAAPPAAAAAPGAPPSPWTAGYESTAFAQGAGYPPSGQQPEPVAYQPPAGQPPPGGYQQPGYQQPGYEQAGYQQPGHEQAGYQQAGYEQAGYEQAGYQQPPAGTPGWGAMPPGRPGMPPGAHGGDDMATALGILFPIQGWLHDKGWRQGLRLLVIAYALLPLIFLATLSSSTRLSTPGWAYSLYVAPLWIMGFWLLIRPGRVGKQEIWAAGGIVVWTLAWMNVVTINVNDALHISGKIGLVPALVIGFNEEITKALPVLLAGLILLRYRKVKLGVRMYMFLGTIAGLTFGIFEQAFYTSTDIIGINQARSVSEAVNASLAFSERIFVDGFQHAVWAGIAGFFIGMGLTYSRRRVQLIVLGVATAAVLHALNDFLAGDSIWLVIVVQAASLLLFLGYTMSAASIEQRVSQTPLFRHGDSVLLPVFQDPGQPPPAASRGERG
jgi:RsiW-degrading membrane proteinase PrsW (M82 family)